VKFTSLSILLKTETSSHVTNRIGSPRVAQALGGDVPVEYLVFLDLSPSAVDHLLRYWNARHSRPPLRQIQNSSRVSI
jgi:hypothetical protein